MRTRMRRILTKAGRGVARSQLLAEVVGVKRGLVQSRKDGNVFDITIERIKRDVMQIVAPPSPMRQIATERLHHIVSQQARQMCEDAALSIKRITSVSGKDFIAAIAREHNFDVLSGEFRNHISRNCRGVRKGFVEVPDQFIDLLTDVRRDDEFVMIRTKMLRGDPRVLQFIVAVFMKPIEKVLTG